MEDIITEHQRDEELVDDSDFDEERMREDEDLSDIMNYVFADESSEEV